MPLWTPTKKTHSYRVEISVKGPKKASEMKSFRKAVKKLARRVKGKIRERKPR